VLLCLLSSPWLSPQCAAWFIPSKPAVFQLRHSCMAPRSHRTCPKQRHSTCYDRSITTSLRLKLTKLLLSDGAPEHDFLADGSQDLPPNIQWELFRKHHARYQYTDQQQQDKISWTGKWTTYDYVGDIVLETMPASVNYVGSVSSSNDAVEKVAVTHTISTGSTSSDCTTCYDDPNTTRTLPITTYQPETISSRTRLAACGMVVGPSIMQSSGTSKCGLGVVVKLT
jgi:hypothetical protein